MMREVLFFDMKRIPRIIITVTNNLVTDHRVSKMAGYLEKRGYEVYLVGRRCPGGDIPAGRPGKAFRFRLLFNKGPLFYLTMNVRLLSFLLLHRCDKILAVDLDTLSAAVIAGKIKRIPVVLDSHEYFPESPELQHRPRIKSIWQKIESVFIRHIASGITVSAGLVSIYNDKYGMDFHLVRNVPAATGEISEIRPVSNEPVIYYQGALNLGRGIEESLRALTFLPGYRMVIVGTGDIEAHLKRVVHELDLEDRVVFKGKVPFEDLVSLGRSAHVGVCLLENIGLNYYHSLPNRLFDYPVMGLPIIATAFPDISEFVNQYNTGILLDSMHPEAIAAAIKSACEDEKLRNTWRESLKETASKLTWENETASLKDLF
jgi:glycosyltransferase involved in cell wall biosynthesis